MSVKLKVSELHLKQHTIQTKTSTNIFFRTVVKNCIIQTGKFVIVLFVSKNAKDYVSAPCEHIFNFTQIYYIIFLFNPIAVWLIYLFTNTS